MKKLRLLISLCVALFSVACSYNELPEHLKTTTTFEDKIALNVETRAETYEGQALDQEYFVTATDLENFVNFRRKESDRSNLSVREVKSYGFDSSQTLFYILNYDKGWEVVAADKRVQPTLAHGDDGTFTMDTDNEPMKFWMNMLADGVLKTRQTSDIATRTSADNSEIGSNYIAFWDNISAQIDNSKETRSPRIQGSSYTPHGYNYLYLIDVEETRDSIKYGPFTPTTWGQKAPWNQFCPLKSNSTTTHAPVGCTATAGAQLLYYFCKRMGIWLEIPSYVQCTGNVDDFEYSFNNYTRHLWSDMALDINDVVGSVNSSAKLMSFIGFLSSMNYGNNGSGAYPDTLMLSLEQLYNISSEKFDGMDSGIVIESLEHLMPVMIWGKNQNTGNGHTWLIDGYLKETVTKTQYFAAFTTEQDESYIAQLDKDDANHISQFTNYNWWYYMNWGMDDNMYYSDKDRLFSTLPADWPYDDVIELIYGFQIR